MIVICFYIILAAVSVWLFFAFALELILPFLIAWLIALMIQPFINRINARTRLPRKFLSGFFVVSAIGLIGFVLFLLLERLFYETRNLFDMLSGNYTQILDSVFGFFDGLTERIPVLGLLGDNDYLMTVLSDIIRSTLSAISSKVPEWIAGLMKMLPDVGFFTVILVMAAFYISVDFRKINAFIAAQLPASVNRVLAEAKKQLVSTSLLYLRAYLLMILITFAQLLIGFLVLKIEYAFTIALFTSVVDVLPVIGVGTVLIPWACVLLIRGEYYIGFGLLIIFAAVALIRQVAEPKIVGVSLGLYPLVTLISMYIGFKIFGFIGIILMPIVVILLKNLNDSGTIRLWKTPVSSKNQR